MRRTLLLGAALLLASPLLVGPASAATAGVPHMKWAQSSASDGSIVEKASWYCRKWRHKCTRRWDWGTPRFYRCMWRHDC
jgi:hypothetical protein